jgi:hypothetical protein
LPFALAATISMSFHRTLSAAQDQTGSIRGVVYDKDFDVPLPGRRSRRPRRGRRPITTDQGNYLIGGVAPGTYTLVFSKPDYVRQVKADVVVSAGKLTDVDVSLAGEFEDMDEFVVQDLLAAGGTEARCSKLRFESPALMDSIGSELMSRAGAATPRAP